MVMERNKEGDVLALSNAMTIPGSAERTLKRAWAVSALVRGFVTLLPLLSGGLLCATHQNSTHLQAPQPESTIKLSNAWHIRKGLSRDRLVGAPS